MHIKWRWILTQASCSCAFRLQGHINWHKLANPDFMWVCPSVHCLKWFLFCFKKSMEPMTKILMHCVIVLPTDGIVLTSFFLSHNSDFRIVTQSLQVSNSTRTRDTFFAVLPPYCCNIRLSISRESVKQIFNIFRPLNISVLRQSTFEIYFLLGSCEQIREILSDPSHKLIALHLIYYSWDYPSINLKFNYGECQQWE